MTRIDDGLNLLDISTDNVWSRQSLSTISFVLTFCIGLVYDVGTCKTWKLLPAKLISLRRSLYMRYIGVLNCSAITNFA